jgi:hypothetical protein
VSFQRGPPYLRGVVERGREVLQPRRRSREGIVMSIQLGAEMNIRRVQVSLPSSTPPI